MKNEPSDPTGWLDEGDGDDGDGKELDYEPGSISNLDEDELIMPVIFCQSII